MQLFAWDRVHSIFAREAKRGESYQCMECKKEVKVRGGPHHQLHFYHTHQRSHCRQKGKSFHHIKLQMTIHSLLSEEATMETPFPKIGRIADVCWPSQNLIFEIQCSAISLEELSARTSDYETLGYQVVWILEDRRYNKYKVSPAEKWARAHLSYFARSTPSIFFYDQAEIVHHFYRKYASVKFPVFLGQPKEIPQWKTLWEEVFPTFLLQRLRSQNIHFFGDAIDRLLKNPTCSLAKSLKQQETSLCHTEKKFSYRFLLEEIRSYYFCLLEWLLKKF